MRSREGEAPDRAAHPHATGSSVGSLALPKQLTPPLAWDRLKGLHTQPSRIHSPLFLVPTPNLHHARAALTAGRLHEAEKLLTHPALRPHRGAQEAITELRQRFVDRGQAHLQAHRVDEARRDARAADRLEPGAPDTAALQARITQRDADAHRHAARAADGLAHAQRLADCGDSTAARQALTDDNAAAHRRLLNHLDVRKLERQTHVERARAALTRQDFAAAAAALQKLTAFPPTADVETLKHEVHEAAVAAATEHLTVGRPAAALDLLTPVAPHAPLVRLCHDLQHAAEQLNAGDPATALTALQRVAHQLPATPWLQDAIAQARQLRDTREALAAGPLGTLTPPLAPHLATAATPATTPPLAWSPAPPSPRPASPSGPPLSPPPLILHRNGEALAVVAATPRVVLAGTGPAAPDTLNLLATPGPGLTLTRDEEGHLIAGPPDLSVNQRSAAAALLSHQDRLTLGPRLRLRYLRPNPASQTAVLELTAGRFATPHLRRIILLANELLLGPHAGCHLRDPSQNDTLTFRPTADGLILNHVELVPGGPPETVGGASWSVTRLT